MATVNPVVRRGSTQDRNRQEEQDGNPQTNDDKVTRSSTPPLVGPYANSTDQMNLGVAAALRSNIYGGVPRATSLTTMVSGGPDADDCAYVEFKVDGPQSALSTSFLGAFQVPTREHGPERAATPCSMAKGPRSH